MQVTGKKQLQVITGSVAITGADTLIAELPSSIEVIAEDGEVLYPEKNFWITIETINPYHLLLDM